jgi:PAS domain S-box-containing protein
MKEMKEYDEAANRFYNSLDLKTFPLVTGDIYLSHFDILCETYQDVLILEGLAESNNWSYCSKFDEVLLRKEQVIIVTDPKLTIVHATGNIWKMNGYRPSEVMGLQPKLFQGPETCSITLGRIRTAIQKREPFEETILNYRKNGIAYVCWIKGEPIFDTGGKLVNFIAYEKEVA